MKHSVERINSTEPEVLISAIVKAKPGSTIISPKWIVSLGSGYINFPMKDD